uniref:hypothetical protein n=1 Tax=Rhizobium fredii TaxID=380 RepID=UPI001AEBF776
MAENSRCPLDLLGLATTLLIIEITTEVLAHTSDSKVCFFATDFYDNLTISYASLLHEQFSRHRKVNR